MHLMISNDDGVHAPGITALAAVLREKFRVTVIAPLEERSTTGHSLSLDKSLRLEKLADATYGVSGFPADCTLMGLGFVLKNDRPQGMVSGINRGANLGQDLYYSGTVAAAREAAFHGVPALATSLVFKSANDFAHYDAAAQVIRMLLEAGLFDGWQKGTLFNLNLPNLPLSEIKGIRPTKIGMRNYSEEVHHRVDTRGRDYFWIAGHYQGHDGKSDSDCQAVDEGFAALTVHDLLNRGGLELQGLEKVVAEVNRAHFS